MSAWMGTLAELRQEPVENQMCMVSGISLRCFFLLPVGSFCCCFGSFFLFFVLVVFFFFWGGALVESLKKGTYR